MVRIGLVLVAVGALAACSSSGGGTAASSGAGGSSAPTSQGITIYHDGFALPACTLGIAPAPCQRTVSPIEVQFATPTDVNHGGGYTVDLTEGAIAVTEYVEDRRVGPCPAANNQPCLSDSHTLVDEAGTWEIRY